LIENEGNKDVSDVVGPGEEETVEDLGGHNFLDNC
jgi:hypothetical protein